MVKVAGILTISLVQPRQKRLGRDWLACGRPWEGRNPMRSLARRLKQIEEARNAAAPEILTVQAIESATGEIIKEFQVVMNEPGRPGNRHRGQYQTEPRGSTAQRASR